MTQASIIDLFSHQVSEHPQNTALKDEKGHYSYSETDLRSSRLAMWLASQGVGLGSRLGLCFSRSAERMIAVLATLKTGASYVPLAASFPAERFAFICHDARVETILTDGQEPFEVPAGCRVIHLSEFAPEGDFQFHELPNRDGDSETYIMYTSGSTGKPKGVIVPDKAVIRLVRDTNYINLTPQERILQLAAFSFDATTFEIWGALLNGGELVVAPEGRLSARDIGQFIEANHITTVFLTTALFNVIVNEALPQLQGLRHLLTGGEVASVRQMKRFQAEVPECTLIHCYGPTENTGFSTCQPLAKIEGNPDSVSIGGAVNGSSIHIMDSSFNRVGQDVDGELCVGGTGLARGYLGRAAITAEKFVPHPHGDAGERLYRTGDLVRSLPDGTLDFQGRLDNQLKIRGFRIEPGEVEQAILQMDGISEAAVIGRQLGDTKQLVAYLVSPEELDVEALKFALGRSLPEFMVPQLFVPLEAMPLNLNGKVDTAALPDPTLKRESQEARPVTPTERILIQVWEEVLELEHITPVDDFFELGGDSILSIQVLGLCEEQGLIFDLVDLFNKPVLADLASLILANGDNQVEPQQEQADQVELPAGVAAIYPASQLQAGMLAYSEATAGSTKYHDLYYLVCETAYRPNDWRRTLDEATDRHPILRTAFDTSSQPINQIVYEKAQIPLTVTELNESNWEAKFKTWLDEERATPIDWTCAPLIHCYVHILSPERHVITFSLHHAILDGWSLVTMITELLDTYNGLGMGCPPLIEAPRARYSEFIEQERQALDSQEHKDFWFNMLDGSPRATLPRLATSSANVAGTHNRAFILDDTKTETLKQRAMEMSVPVKTLLLAVHLEALATITGNRDVLSGYLVHGRRERSGGDRTLGLFLNNLPLRLQLGRQSWRQLVAELRERENGCWQYRHFPNNAIRSLMGWDHLLEAGFNFTHYQAQDDWRNKAHVKVSGTGLMEHSSLPFVCQTALSADKREISIRLEYDPRELSANQIAEYAAIYEGLTHHLCDNPNALVEAAYSRQAHQEELPQATSTVVELYNSVVEQFAGNLAVVDHKESLTYEQLDRRANQLANYLVTYGVGPEMPVGVCLGRSVDLYVSFLAVLKAGGVYVPLDPDYPSERLAHMLNDAGIMVLIGTEETLDRVPTGAAPVMVPVNLDLDRPMLEAQPEDMVWRYLTPSQTAYLIYTSGSTGKPKGARIPYRGLANLAVRQMEHLELCPGMRNCQFASPGFDASVFEMSLSLFSGGTFYVPSDQIRLSPGEFAAFLSQNNIDLVTLTPSFLGSLDPEAVPQSMRVLSAGEALPEPVAAAWSRRLELFNLYGPTEASVWSTWHRHGAQPKGKVPIGIAVGGVQLYILGDFLNPLPTGTPGMLYLGGVSLANHYHARPGATAAAFIPDPYGSQAGGRLYRSGDLVSRLETGALAYHGRKDNQVKIRGFRIEIGEIEYVLAGVAGVAETAVIVVRDGNAVSLAGFVVADPSASQFSLDQVEADIARELPEYMRPRLIPLQSMPLTPNGKIDRKALATMTDGADGELDLYAAPRDTREHMLVEIWQEVLNKERVGIDDSFFVLGGDSIVSIQVRARVQALGFDFNLETLFAAQTIRELAPLLKQLNVADALNQLEPFELVPERLKSVLVEEYADAYPISRLQAGMLYHLDLSGDDGVYHDIMTYHLRGSLDTDVFERALNIIAENHAVLRTSFALSRYEMPLQLVHKQVWIPLQVHDWRDRDETARREALDAWIETEKYNAFDLSAASLLRVVMMHWSDDELILCFSCPHAILDGWSVAVLMDHLFGVYSRLLAGEEPAPEQVPATFAQFIGLEQEALARQASRDFWMNLMDGYRFSALPRFEQQTTRQLPLRMEIPITDETRQRLQALGEQMGLSLKTLFLAAHFKAVSLLSGNLDVTTGIVANGRPETEGAERVLGLFLNSLPLRLKLNSESWHDLVGRVCELEKAYWPHRRFPMPEIKSQLGGKPLYETLMNYTHFHVYERLEEEHGFSLVETGGYEYANFPMIFQCGIRAWDSGVHTFLDIDQAQITPEQSEEIAAVYAQVLTQLATKTDQVHAYQAPFTAKVLGEDQTREEGLRASLARIVAERENETALIWEHGKMTYGELDDQSKRSANLLRGLGVGPGSRVGLALERGPSLITAILGIVQAGAAYVPLDTQYPADRLAFMVEDANLELILCDDESLWRDAPCQVFPWDQVEAMLEAFEASVPEMASTPMETAYIMYTSGTTGRPKGVAIPHQGIVRLVRDTNYVELSHDDVVLQLAPVSFDASTFEIWAALLNGGVLALAPAGRNDLEDIAAAVERFGVTTMWLTASLFNAMVDQRPEALYGLRYMLAGGEALSVPHVSRFLEGARGTVLVNGYGPTENTTFSLCHGTTSFDSTQASVPIGHPISGSSATIVDAFANPVGNGIPGELWVGGAGLAMCYWQRPGLTAEKFVPDPFSKDPGRRAYRTGDRVRLTPNGLVEFLGRDDAQVKIRGFRIEPGEIEARLLEHEQVREAVVSAPEVNGKRRLVAYVVADDSSTAQELTDWLAARLPEYMVPQNLMLLEQMPLTPNGKLDVRNLPNIENDDTATLVYMPPRNETETILVGIWQEVLALERVGIHDNFFELGGDSILSIQIKSQAQDRGLDFNLEDLLSEQTIAGLSACIEDYDASEQEPEAQAFDLLNNDEMEMLSELLN